MAIASVSVKWSGCAVLLATLISYSAIASVSALPVITRHPNDNGNITVARGSNVTLSCIANSSGNGTLNYRWRRVSGSLPSNRRGRNSEILTIFSIAFSDSGQYYCEVSDGEGIVSSMRVQVTVKWRPTITHIPSEQQLSIVSGYEEVMLTCEVLNVGNDIFGGYWERVDNGPLPVKNNMSSLVEETSVVTLLHLTITRARPMHSGKYQCIVYNEVGIDQSNNVTVTITIVPPNITKQPTDITIQAMQHTTFTCEASGFKVRYEWKRHNISNTIGKESNLTVLNATPLDEDQYYCVAMTEGGYAFSNNVTLRVNDDIRIRVHPREVTVSESGTIILSIDARGVGRNLFTYEWKKVGSDLLPDTASGGNSTVLTITSVTSSDSGLYYCIVMNQWGNMVKSNNATVNVLYITTYPKDTVTGVGRNVTLTCNASGADNLKYQWIRMGNKTIPSTARGVNSNTLIIPNITVDDSGQYKCIVSSGDINVTSEYGNVSVLTLSLTINNNSDGPVSVAEGSNVTLRCMVTGGGNLNYQWRRVSGSLPSNVRMSNGGQSLTIHSIAVSDSGEYYCEVDNGEDSVSSMRVQVTARRRPSISGVSDDQMLSIVSGNEEVMLTCNVNGDDITGGYWERVDDPLPNRNNMSSLSNNKKKLTITISRARPTDSGRYRCVVYSQWGVAQSRNVQVTITIAPPMITRQPINQTITALQDVTFTCEAKGFDVKYEWKRHSGNVTGGIQSSLTISRATPLDEDQYYCVAMTEGGYAFSNNVTLIVNDCNLTCENKGKIQPDCSACLCMPGYEGITCDIDIDECSSDPCQNGGSCVDGINSYDCICVCKSNIDECFDNPCQNGGTCSDNDIDQCSPNPCQNGETCVDFYTNNSCSDQFCKTWNETQAGVTVPCTGHGLNGTICRRCKKNHLWEEHNNCFRQEIRMLLQQATNLINESFKTEAIAVTSNIANTLVNVTASTEEPIFAIDVNLTVNILSTLNNITETFVANLTANDTIFEDAASVIDNLLSDTNQDNWRQLEMTSPSTSQGLVSSAERITKLLSETLTNNSTEAIITRPNIIIKAERITNDSVQKDYVFPDEDDNLAAYTGGSAQLTVSSSLLQNISSGELTIASTVIRNNNGLRLPSDNNRSKFPVSPIFSLQINPLPDAKVLKENPIMMTFDVDYTTVLSNQTSVENVQVITVNDLSCNFYDYTLVTNDSLNQTGGWSTKGLTVDKSHSNKTLVTCLTTHLTSFAVLVSIQDERTPSPADKALSIISYIGCSISLVCLCISIIFLSYTIYKVKDNKNNLFIHLNLCIALALGIVVFIGGIENATTTEESCKVVAALLQYLFISAFCWMLCEGIMLYMMLVTVFGNRLNNRCFFLILGWGPAIPIVAISAGLTHEHYGTENYCWIKSDDGAIAAFIVPIVVIMLINCIFLGISLKVLWQHTKTSKQVSSNKDSVKNLLRAAVILLPLLGMTWIIGIFAVNNETQVFAWIFAILNSLQGVFIFVLHVIRNMQVARVIRERYNFMRKSAVFSRLVSIRGTGHTSTSGISSKARTTQNTPSKISDCEKNTSTISTTTGGDKTLKEDSIDDQIKLTAFKKVEEAIIDESNAGVVHKESTEEDRKSTTEDDAVIVAERNDPAATIKE